MKKTIKIVVLCVTVIALISTLGFITKNRPKETVIDGDEKAVEESIKPVKDAEQEIKTDGGTPSPSPIPDDDELIPPPKDTSEPIVVNPEPDPEPYTDFEAYNNMSEAEQKAYYESFESPEAFFAWYNQAKAEYENSRNDILLDGSTNVDFGG